MRICNKSKKIMKYIIVRLQHAEMQHLITSTFIVKSYLSNSGIFRKKVPRTSYPSFMRHVFLTGLY